ncbi:protein Frey 1 [Moschus berezovskii]|uniref:protein Frey 1 n=1 Tax=Moschus berezovskii TaxID=68408 RepID=UPI002444739C|nr:protein Frey 1 [Moschus berezovskii]
MVLAMLGALHPRAGLSLFILYLVLAATLLRPQPLRPQRSVPEEFSAPLELSEPLSGLVDGRLSPPHSLMGEPCPGSGYPASLRACIPHSLCVGKTSGGCRRSLPLTPFSPSLDYGVRPKHPWPRGPRPLLSRAQQRKRDGPDMAEYYYDSRL